MPVAGGGILPQPPQRRVWGSPSEPPGTVSRHRRASSRRLSIFTLWLLYSSVFPSFLSLILC